MLNLCPVGQIWSMESCHPVPLVVTAPKAIAINSAITPLLPNVGGGPHSGLYIHVMAGFSMHSHTGTPEHICRVTLHWICSSDLPCATDPAHGASKVEDHYFSLLLVCIFYKLRKMRTVPIISRSRKWKTELLNLVLTRWWVSEVVFPKWRFLVTVLYTPLKQVKHVTSARTWKDL